MDEVAKSTMDFVKSLVEDSNLKYLQELARVKYPTEEDDTVSDKEFIFLQRETFVRDYHKRNNRQFEWGKYKLTDYKKIVDRYESKNDITVPV